MHLEGSCHCKSVTFQLESDTPYPYMRCYCSICRKTAGGGGYAINIMGKTETFQYQGLEHVGIYRVLVQQEGKNPELSSAHRHFCKNCATCLWISDPQWPHWIYPFASAIDTPLPVPPERIHMMLDFAAPWCEIPNTKNDVHFSTYPEESIEDWHKRHKLSDSMLA